MTVDQQQQQSPAPPAAAYISPIRFDRPVLNCMQSIGKTNNARVLAIVLLLLFVAGVGSLFSPWQQFVTGYGRVNALTPVERQQTIDARVNGRVVRWHVIEGSRVRAGDLIAEMEDNAPAYLLTLEQQRRDIESRLSAATERELLISSRIRELQSSRDSQLQAARARVESASDRVRQSEQNRDAVDARVKQNKLQLDRRKAGFQGGISSQRDLEVAQADYDIALADLKRANAALDEARNNLKAQEEDLRRIDADTNALVQQERASRASAQADIQTQRVSLQDAGIRLARQQLQRVVAPSDGTVFRLLVQPNAAILKEGDAIAEFVPDVNDMMVEIDVDGNDMPLITAGRHVRIQFEGWAAVPLVGWPSVAIGTFGGRVLLVDPTVQANNKFRVMVVPDPDDSPWPSRRFLRQGVRANAFVLLDTVPLGLEIWRRLNGFPPVVQGVADEIKSVKPAKKK